MSKKFDIAYSIGDTCGPALYLRRCLMRFASGPMDWLAGGSLKTRTHIIATGFDHFMEESDLERREREPGHGDEFPHDYYYNTTNGLKHYHDFLKKRPLSETYPAAREKYNRRIARFEHDLSTKRVLLFWLSLEQSTSDNEVLACCEEVLQKYEANRHNIHFLIIEHNPGPGTTHKFLKDNIERYTLNLMDEECDGWNVTMGNTHRVCPILIQYEIQNSHALLRHLKIKRFFIRLLTVLIPVKSWRREARRKMYNQSDITW